MTGKSSWVHSRTQGSIPMLFCRWADVLWLLHSLLVPSNGWWLDQGRWSLYLLFCFCGNDQLWHCNRLSVCVVLKLWSFRYLRTWFVITLSELQCMWWMCELDVIVIGDCWTYYDLGWMYELWFEILRDFTDYRDYMGLSLMVRACKWSLLGLMSYNLGSFVTEMAINFVIPEVNPASPFFFLPYFWFFPQLFTWYFLSSFSLFFLTFKP